MILVTGGAGFIGSNLVAALEARGEADVVVSDRLRTEDKWRNLARRELAAIVHPDGLEDFLARHGAAVRRVFHMGAISSTTETDADRIVETNVRLSQRLWDWCTDRQVPFVYASSAATYGDGSHGFDDDPDPEALARLRPLNPYGWSKLLFDRRVARLVSRGDPRPPQWAGLRFFNVFGPNEYHKGPMQSVVAKSYPAAARGEPVTLFRSHRPDYEDGGQMRDFVSVRDCVSVMLWLMENPDVSGLFNVGTGRARTFADLVGAVFAALGQEPLITYVDTPEAIRDRYQYFTEARMERLRQAGYDAPFLALEEGVGDYVRNHLAAEDPHL